MIKRGSKTVGHKSESIKKVTLPGAIRPEEEHQLCQFHFARRDALVVADCDPLYERFAHCSFNRLAPVEECTKFRDSG
jgi:hypothetical protein